MKSGCANAHPQSLLRFLLPRTDWTSCRRFPGLCVSFRRTPCPIRLVCSSSCGSPRRLPMKSVLLSAVAIQVAPPITNRSTPNHHEHFSAEPLSLFSFDRGLATASPNPRKFRLCVGSRHMHDLSRFTPQRPESTSTPVPLINSALRFFPLSRARQKHKFALVAQSCICGWNSRQ
jgi:hypothetical protein